LTNGVAKKIGDRLECSDAEEARGRRWSVEAGYAMPNAFILGSSTCAERDYATPMQLERLSFTSERLGCSEAE
jgi:hypothetical protein